jgi:hypothetical protein
MHKDEMGWWKGEQNGKWALTRGHVVQVAGRSLARCRCQTQEDCKRRRTRGIGPLKSDHQGWRQIQTEAVRIVRIAARFIEQSLT